MNADEKDTLIRIIESTEEIFFGCKKKHTKKKTNTAVDWIIWKPKYGDCYLIILFFFKNTQFSLTLAPSSTLVAS